MKLDFVTSTATLAAGFCLLSGLFCWIKNPKNSATLSFFFFNLTLAVWNLSEWVAYLQNYKYALYLYRGCYVGGSFISFSFLTFMYATARFKADTPYKIIQWLAVSFAFLSLTPAIITRIEFQMLGHGPLDEIHGPFYYFFIAFFILSLLYGLSPLFVSFRSADGSRKNQFRYMMLAIVVGVLGIVNFVLSQVYTHIPPLYYLIQIGMSATFAVAILKHRLMDIGVIIRRTLVYSAVMVTLTIIYLCVVALFTRIFEGITGYQTLFSSALAAGLITIFFQPLRKRIQAIVDKKFFRHYVDREEKLYELSREVVTHTTTEDMGGALARVLDDTLHPKRVALYLRSGASGHFDLVSVGNTNDLPAILPEDNQLAQYFKEIPKPFLLDMESPEGRSYSTRLKDEREDVA